MDDPARGEPQSPPRTPRRLTAGRLGALRRERNGIGMRHIVPNAMTAMAFCAGLTGIRYGISQEWERALLAVVVAAVLDGLDGRVARMLRGQSRFGAEMDSLSDATAFGVSPALIIYLWSLQAMPRFGWIVALCHALACVLRLARFNANIDVDNQPHKRAGYLTGVPAPAGAMLAFIPLLAWMVSGQDIFRDPLLVGPWLLMTAFLMISNVATFSWKAMRIRRTIRLEVIGATGLIAALLISDPWLTLLILSLAYLAVIPFGVMSYAKVKRQQRNAGGSPGE